MVLSLFARDFGSTQLQSIIDDTYTAENFRYVRAGGDPSKIVNLYKLWRNLYLAELTAGPTLAFKDVALQLLAPIVAKILNGARFRILGGTSGDTGPAAIAAFMPYLNIDVFMMSGGAGMSPLQRAQMDSVQSENVHNIRLPNFDMTQDLFKAVFAHPDFVAEYHIGAVNSVNLVRILAQVVYTFWSYLQVATSPGEIIDFVVPSGNFGNAFNVYMAKLMGLPVGRIIIATNENDVLHRFFETGVYERAQQVTPTTSPSMDIQVASNLERAIFYALGENADRVRELYAEFKRTNRFELTPAELKLVQDAGFLSAVCTEDQGKETIRRVFAETGYIIDPHTAVGVTVAGRFEMSGRKTVVYETASPLKFADLVTEVTGEVLDFPPKSRAMLAAPQRVDVFETLSAEELMQYIRDRARL
jgi:threonine synthase